MMTDQSAMDGNLLLSVLGGLGRIEISDDGSEMYIKDDDCVGEHLSAGLFSMPERASAASVRMLIFPCAARVPKGPPALPPAR